MQVPTLHMQQKGKARKHQY
uniref:Uncharacterized protein n=1 Tax=Arundo donax TaxID=35708 RepID=A0A0A9ASE0_ARUDO